MGKLVTVEIVSASKFSMVSRVVTEAAAANPVPVKTTVPAAAAAAAAAAEMKQGRSSLNLPVLATCVAALAYFVLRFLSLWQ